MKKGSEALQNIRYFLKPATQRPLRLILIYFFCSHCASLIGLRPFLVNIFNAMSLPIDSRWVVVSIIIIMSMIIYISARLYIKNWNMLCTLNAELKYAEYYLIWS